MKFATLENPDHVTSADIVVGIPSRNEADAIAFPVEQASLGLTTHFRGKRAVIVNCDNASEDGTKEAFFSAPCQVPRMYVSTEKGVTGKGNNIRNLLHVVGQLKADAVVILDADLRSMTPKWIKYLCEPLFSDYGFVSPIYERHKYDGTLTSNIIYPHSRCLYGRRVRHPTGGEFGFSGEMAQFYLSHESWNDAVAHGGIDIWLTTLAMYFRKPITQAFLGRPKIHRATPPGERCLGNGFREVVGTMFQLQERFAPFWKEVRRSRPTSIFGFGFGEVEEPPPVSVDLVALYKYLHDGRAQWDNLWREAFLPATYAKLNEVLEMDINHFELPVQLWAHLLFDISAAYRDRIASLETLMDCLAPLHCGRTLSYVRATEGMGLQQAEEYIEEQCLAFEEAKPYLLERWGT